MAPIHPLVDFGPTMCGLAVTAGDDVSIQFVANVDLASFVPMAAAVVNRQSRVTLQAFTIVQGNDWDGAQSSVRLEMTAAQSLLLQGRSMDWWWTWTAAGDVRTVIAGSFSARAK